MDHDDFEEVLPPCPVELAADETLTQIWPVQEQEWKDYVRNRSLHFSVDTIHG
jgi:hypothetical protein